MDAYEILGRTTMLAGVLAIMGAGLTASLPLGIAGVILYTLSTFLF